MKHVIVYLRCVVYIVLVMLHNKFIYHYPTQLLILEFLQLENILRLSNSPINMRSEGTDSAFA